MPPAVCRRCGARILSTSCLFCDLGEVVGGKVTKIASGYDTRDPRAERWWIVTAILPSDDKPVELDVAHHPTGGWELLAAPPARRLDFERWWSEQRGCG